MQKWPSGSYLVMKTMCPQTNIPLYALAYKYNIKKVLCFVMTANAGSTIPGSTPYIAQFPDKYGNLSTRNVPRPEVLATYFGHSNIIDSLNHKRQHLLGLERLWKTINPWWRNDLTIIGMTAIDCLAAIKYHCPNFKHLTVEEYADRLAYDCVNNPYSSKVENPRGYIESDIAVDSMVARRDPGNMPGFVFGNSLPTVNGLAEGVQRMAMTCCGGVSTASGISPLSFGGVSAGTFAFPVDGSGDHDVRKQRVSGANNRAVKRRCWICSKDTRWECNNPNCMRHQYEYDGEMFDGVPLCPPNVGARTHTTKHGTNNKLTCLQLHRNEIRSGSSKSSRHRRWFDQFRRTYGGDILLFIFAQYYRAYFAAISTAVAQITKPHSIYTLY